MLYTIKGFFKSLLCEEHEYELRRNIFGDEANYARSEWRCKYCDKHVYSRCLDALDPVPPPAGIRAIKFVFQKFRYYIGRTALVFLNPEDKAKIVREHRYFLELQTAETWLCEFPQMVDALRYVRVHVLGRQLDNEKERDASQEISSYRETLRRRYDPRRNEKL